MVVGGWIFKQNLSIDLNIFGLAIYIHNWQQTRASKSSMSFSKFLRHRQINRVLPLRAHTDDRSKLFRTTLSAFEWHHKQLSRSSQQQLDPYHVWGQSVETEPPPQLWMMLALTKPSFILFQLACLASLASGKPSSGEKIEIEFWQFHVKNESYQNLLFVFVFFPSFAYIALLFAGHIAYYNRCSCKY